MRVWITGIAGFLGSHLADILVADKNEVDGNDTTICGDPDNYRGDFYMTDCRDFEGMKYGMNKFKPEVLVHCAATAHEGLSNFSPAFITKNIYEASVATFSAAIASGVKRIVYMSSMSRYGRSNPPFREYMRPAPVDPYGIAKVAAEETLKALCRLHGVAWTIAVPHNIIGVRQRACDPYRNVAAIMINRCKQGKAPIVYGDGSQTRCFSPIADVLPSLVQMIHGSADSEIVNIGPDTGTISVRAMAEMVTNLTGCNQEIQYYPDRPNEVKHAMCSSDLARKLLGYKEQQSIEDCLKDMVAYIKPQDFVYDFPIEIEQNCPTTWSNKEM